MTKDQTEERILPRRLAEAARHRPVQVKPWPINAIVPRGPIIAPEVMGRRIVVVTLTTAGKLLTVGVHANHFTDLFVDEAGQATEPEVNVPMQLLNMYVRTLKCGIISMKMLCPYQPGASTLP